MKLVHLDHNRGSSLILKFATDRCASSTQSNRDHFTAFGTGLAMIVSALFTGFVLTACDAAAKPQPTQSTPAAAKPMIRTNQEFLENLGMDSDLDIENIGAVFRHILSALPAQVKVYPTENYYYFRFYHGGIEYAGNIRLAASDRDDGLVHFAYFPAANSGRTEGEMHYKPLGKEDGVSITKLGQLSYSIEYLDKSIIFNLNDLSDVKPNSGLLAVGEEYLGPVYDESGIQFYLMYNPSLKIFHYVLNEQNDVPDELVPASYTDKIVIGRRTGFAFYRDARIDRKILIGVHAANVAINNYYDGPFDQLPDNFNKDDRLRLAIEESDPATAGRIDGYGYYKSGEGRYLIGPYMQYNQEQELVNFHLCATNPQLDESLYYSCFAIQGGGH